MQVKTATHNEAETEIKSLPIGINELQNQRIHETLWFYFLRKKIVYIANEKITPQNFGWKVVILGDIIVIYPSVLCTFIFSSTVRFGQKWHHCWFSLKLCEQPREWAWTVSGVWVRWHVHKFYVCPTPTPFDFFPTPFPPKTHCGLSPTRMCHHRRHPYKHLNIHADCWGLQKT